MIKPGPTLLIILDGYGYKPEPEYNAIRNAHKPNLDAWFIHYPSTLLEASGTAVGLLPDTIGNSEVGHLTIGTGRVTPEASLWLHRMIDDGSFFKLPLLVDSFNALKKSNGRLHLLGLLSDAGVHSHIKHLFALLKMACQKGLKEVYIHPFLDGRDVPPRSAVTYLKELKNAIDELGCGAIGSIHGRFYAMDRDQNWERTQQSYDVLTKAESGKKLSWDDIVQKIEDNYAHNMTDEFIPPFQIDAESVIKPGDGVVFFNFRADRARQLMYCFVEPEKISFHPQPLNLKFFITMTDYDKHLKINPKAVRSYGFVLPRQHIDNTLKFVLYSAGKTMYSIAETEKYAHVTYFFSGGHEKKLPNEQWVLVPSIKTKDYVHHPHMSAREITEHVLDSLAKSPKDFYLINYANADMVAHSGNYEATVKAVSHLDHELKRLYDRVIGEMDGTIYITGDHGNAELLFDIHTGQPKTSHTTNPVPFLMIQRGLEDSKMELPLKELADIAPFILTQLQLPVPPEMKGAS